MEGQRRLRHGSLFSGIGGFDLAAEWMGWDNVFHCELNVFCKQVLSYYYPNAKSYGNIKETDFRTYKGCIDILTGGFPCQPFSVAGKRQGTADERHLWPDMLRAVREIRPQWIVGENVRGIISWNAGVVFEQVQAELEAEGYQVQPYVLPAAGLGAPHRRERVWFIAYAGSNGYGGNRHPEDRQEAGKTEGNENQRQRVWHEPGRDGATHAAAYTDNIRCDNWSNYRQERSVQSNQRPAEKDQSERQIREPWAGPASATPANAYSFGLERDASEGLPEGRRGQPGSEAFESAGDLGIPNWENFPQTQPTICRGNDGLPGKLDFDALFELFPTTVMPMTFPKWRTESIKALGNAIVPQLAYQIFKAIEQTMVKLK